MWIISNTCYNLEVDVLNIQGYYFYATYCGNIPKDEYLLARLLPVEILNDPGNNEWASKLVDYGIYSPTNSANKRWKILRKIIGYIIYSKHEVEYLLYKLVQVFPDNLHIDCDKHYLLSLDISQTPVDKIKHQIMSIGKKSSAFQRLEYLKSGIKETIAEKTENRDCKEDALKEKKGERMANSKMNNIISFDPCTDIIYVIPAPRKNTVPSQMVNTLNEGRHKIKINVLADKNKIAHISFYFHQEKNMYIIHESTLLRYMGDYGYLILKFCHLSDMDDKFGIKYEYLYLQSKDYRRRFLCNLIDLQLYSIQHIIEVLNKLFDSGTISQKTLLSDTEFLRSYKPRYISYQKTVQQLVSKPIKQEDDKLIMKKSLSIMQNITSSQDKLKLLSEMFDKLYDNIVINSVKGLGHTYCVKEDLLTETSIQNQDMSEFFYGYLLPHITQQIKVIATTLTMNDGINELLTIGDVRFIIRSTYKVDVGINAGIKFQGVNSLKKAVRTVVAKYQANREIKLQKNQQPRQIPFNPEQLHTVYLYSHKNALKENEYEMVNVLVRCANSQDVVPITVYYSKAQNKYFLNSASYLMYKKKHGLPYIKLEYYQTTENQYHMKDQSDLKLYGYSVSKTDGLSQKERQELIGQLIGAGLMEQHQIINHLEWLIRSHQYDERFDDACYAWQNDLEFTYSYTTKSNYSAVFDIEKPHRLG